MFKLEMESSEFGAKLAEMQASTTTPAPYHFLNEFTVELVPASAHHPLRELTGWCGRSFFVASQMRPDGATSTTAAATHSSLSSGYDDDGQSPSPTSNRQPMIQPPTVQVGASNIPNKKVAAATTTNNGGELIRQWDSSPMTLDDARYLVSLYITGHPSATTTADGNATINAPPFWAVCNDPESPLLGAWCEKKGNVATLKVGCPDNNATPASSKEVMPLEHFVDQYNATAEMSSANNDAKVSKEARAVFEMLGSTIDDNSGIGLSQSSISIRFLWDDPTETLAPPSSSASAEIKIRAVPGDSQSIAHPLFAELTILQGLDAQRTAIAEAVADGEGAAVEEMAWLVGGSAGSGPDPSSASANEAGNAAEQVGGVSDGIAAFVARLADTSAAATAARASDAAHERDAAETAGQASLSVRSDLDFTEQLWDFVKGAANYRDLRKALTGVFKALQQGTFQPTVHKSNTTLIGRVALHFLSVHRGLTEGSTIDDIAFAELRQSLSDPCKLIDCIIEVGAGKLKRDYSSHLIGEELCTGRHLETFFNSVGGFGIARGAATCSAPESLARLHNVVELFAVSKSYVDVAHTSLRELVTAALAYYSTHQSDTLPIFAMSLPAFSESALKVKRLCGTVEPAHWSVRVGGKSIDSNSDALMASFSQRRPDILPERDTSVTTGTGDDGRRAYSSTPAYYHTLAETTVAAC